MTPDEYCKRKAAASGSSFTTSFLFLPAERRRAITALYAFCREVDDAVDECPEAGIARGRLDGWRDEIAALDEGRPTHPVTQALAAARERFSLPTEQLLEIIDGMEMDLDHARYPDFKALHLYCYRVASVVGLLAAEIFGVTDRRTLKYAHDLGLAFQLTNIIRDVGEDARRGRIYLPQDELARFGVSEADLLECRPSDNFRRLMEFQATRAVEHYGRALAQLPAADRKAQRAGLIMAAIYRETLDDITRGGFDVLDRRTRLTKPRKLWIAVKTWLAA
ncbi:MAG: presqualene diphosphate synthase HpnD [Candidatus Nitricoxidivorans perseverans]|uniref:Presqualene diphosphate synthase HpnD n=1 Tax=Candidatus Nitricoxidivorans perseverans TaxID=2975601 RepID=A0AA49FLS9_9PROT|nr:MAG: presqualene diphosphate synthase HpnD [Candidatus Nitricoxidivorans perseverans]